MDCSSSRCWDATKSSLGCLISVLSPADKVMELKLFCIQCQDTQRYAPSSTGRSRPACEDRKFDQPWVLWHIQGWTPATPHCEWSPKNTPYLVSQLSTIAVTECWCLTPVFHVSHVSQGRSSTRTRLGASWCINASTKQLFLLWHSSRPWELSKRCCTKPRVHARSGTARDQNE